MIANADSPGSVKEACQFRWAVDITRWNPESSEMDFLLSLVPHEEAELCRKFHFFEDQKRAIVSRLLQRHAGASALGLPHDQVIIHRTKGKKPYVANDVHKDHAPNFNFSVSHEGDYVVLASEPLCICGCDVAAPQQLRRSKNQVFQEMLKSFEKQFTRNELECILMHAPDQGAMETAFRKHWSLKEAFVKAMGLGVAFDLGDVEFRIQDSKAKAVVQGEVQEHWAFHLHELGKHHWVSVARAPVGAVVDAWGVGFV